MTSGWAMWTQGFSFESCVDSDYQPKNVHSHTCTSFDCLPLTLSTCWPILPPSSSLTALPFFSFSLGFSWKKTCSVAANCCICLACMMISAPSVFLQMTWFHSSYAESHTGCTHLFSLPTHLRMGTCPIPWQCEQKQAWCKESLPPMLTWIPSQGWYS